jgi:hypothetical protein
LVIGNKARPITGTLSSISPTRKLDWEQPSSKTESSKPSSSKQLNPDIASTVETIPQESDTLEQPEVQSKPEKQTESTKTPNAGNIYIAFTPISWHLDDIKSKVNDFPLGIGFAYDFNVMGEDYGWLKGTIVSAEFSIFKDSNFGYPSGFAGITFRKNIVDNLQIGLGTGLVYTTQLESISGSPILPYVLPYIQTDFDFPVNLRIIYIPSVSDFKSQQLFFTLFTKVN